MLNQTRLPQTVDLWYQIHLKTAAQTLGCLSPHHRRTRLVIASQTQLSEAALTQCLTAYVEYRNLHDSYRSQGISQPSQGRGSLRDQPGTPTSYTTDSPVNTENRLSYVLSTSPSLN